MTLRDAYAHGIAYLQKSGVLEASLDAWYLLEHVTGIRKSYYLAHGEQPLTAEQERTYEELLEQRGKRIPLQHIIGCQEFMGLSFRVSPAVLIPRQDTETLVEEALKRLKPGMRILDVCTGSGCILLSLLHHCPGTTGVGVDISSEALEIAKANGDALGLWTSSEENSRAGFYRSDMFGEIDPTELFDCIVSNPPYIASAELSDLMEEVRDHEPKLALDGGTDGLDFYRILALEAGAYLKQNGHLILEIGYDQGESVPGLLQEAGFCCVQVVQDLCGKDRVVCAVKQ